MLETQPKWYIPAWNVLGWHIGFWNLIGALGFTVSASTSFRNSPRALVADADVIDLHSSAVRWDQPTPPAERNFNHRWLRSGVLGPFSSVASYSGTRVWTSIPSRKRLRRSQHRMVRSFLAVHHRCRRLGSTIAAGSTARTWDNIVAKILVIRLWAGRVHHSMVIAIAADPGLHAHGIRRSSTSKPEPQRDHTYGHGALPRAREV